MALETGSHLAGPGRGHCWQRAHLLAGGLPGPLAGGVSDGIPSEDSWQGPGHQVRSETGEAGRVQGGERVHTRPGPQGSPAGISAKASRPQAAAVGRGSGPAGSTGGPRARGGDSGHWTPDHALFPFPLSSTLRMLAKPQSLHSSHFQFVWGIFPSHLSHQACLLLPPRLTGPPGRLHTAGLMIGT